jgi:hypothetical protein
MDSKAAQLSHRARDGRRWDVEQMLDDALSEVREHRREMKRALEL